MEYVDLICRFTTGLVFLAAFVGKLAGWAGFRASVPDLAPGLPPAPVAVAVVVAEAGVVVLLAVPMSVSAGYALGAGLLAAFAVAVWLALRRGTSGTCRCFGVTATPLGFAQVVRNTLAAAVAVLGWAVHAGGAAPDLAGVVLSLAAAAALASVLVFFDDLADVLKPMS
ncbi:MauE/DoxX family redox-associated membrane protein [Streptosporangium canum]|uniref:MauE/DoxX family redox-associated membrane protein n=1 Tax=Streptosporangium canum TaxID=324952 RepID=UPI00342EC9F7